MGGLLHSQASLQSAEEEARERIPRADLEALAVAAVKILA
jgi:hypothetical protein